MARIRVPLSNFQFGEVSPSMVSRTDTKIYQNAAKKIENFFLRNGEVAFLVKKSIK